MNKILFSICLTSLFICCNSCNAFSGNENALSLSDLDKNVIKLYGSPASVIYIRLSTGIFPIPSSYWFDAKTIYAGASFTNGHGRIVIGDYKSLQGSTLKKINDELIEKYERCGLSIVRSGKDEHTETVMINNGREYLWFAVLDPQLWKTAIELYCKTKHEE